MLLSRYSKLQVKRSFSNRYIVCQETSIHGKDEEHNVRNEIHLKILSLEVKFWHFLPRIRWRSKQRRGCDHWHRHEQTVTCDVSRFVSLWWVMYGRSQHTIMLFRTMLGWRYFELIKERPEHLSTMTILFWWMWNNYDCFVRSFKRGK